MNETREKVPQLNKDLELKQITLFAPGPEASKRFSPTLINWEGFKDFGYYCRSEHDSVIQQCNFLKQKP